MIVCPGCEHHNAEDAQTCAACGASLEGFFYRVCPACGALSPAQNTYCHRCLAELVAHGEPQAPQASDTVTPFEPAEPLPPDLLVSTPRAARIRPSAPARDTHQPAPAPEAPATEALPAVAPQLAQMSEAAAATKTTQATDVVPPTSQPREEHAPVTPAVAAAPTTGLPLVGEIESDASIDLTTPLPEAVVGALASAEDLLPLEAPVSLPHRAQAATLTPLGETEQFDAELFRNIANESASLHAATRVVLPRQARVLPAIGRACLYLLVLLAAVTPFITGGQAFGTNLAIQPSAEVSALAQDLEALPPDAHVLVSIDYEPAYAGELDTLALAVIEHLASRNANLVVMSTKPAGMGLAQRLFRTVADRVPTYQTYGERYALAGYLAGQEAGLRLLTGALDGAFKQDYQQQQPLSQLAATRGVATISEFDGIIVISDDSQAVRRWIEQVHSRNQIPLYALVSARIKPLLVPYARSGQLSALLGGVGEAAEFGAASLGPQWVMAHSDAYVALFGVLVLVAIITNVAYLARKRVKRS